MLPELCPPRVAIDLLIPTTRPWRSTSWQPELPALIEASVWIITPVVDRHSRALTTPDVTVPSGPSGAPARLACLVSPSDAANSRISRTIRMMGAHPFAGDAAGMDTQRTAARYQIHVRGRLGETLLAAFPGLHATMQGNETVLAGALPDQAALYGVLAQVEALGLELLEVRRDHS